ncbi:DUF6934 family protein [Dyadobacter luticola]|uniref:Uncharacterized protein n=1 Tax=Dyadobacter luticola TaxID=1979387 RepID=A0A5R9KXJ7_9BACT|nr:hypothetical protein [Dyadobacter luticola]TLV00868.1 hypothetical protein FEN17_15450 [Dyadobacter luticola]
MNEPFYEFTILDEAHRFDFVSVGKENIPKRIVYFTTRDPFVVTLTLGNPLENGDLDVHSIDDNGDRNKILATVMQSIRIFLNFNPQTVVAFYGSSPSRTRLYKMVISRELNQLSDRYVIHGGNQDGVEIFSPKGEYDFFMISRKNI